MLKKIYKAYHHAPQNHIWQGFRMGYIHQQVLADCNTCTISALQNLGTVLTERLPFFSQIKMLKSLRAILRRW